MSGRRARRRLSLQRKAGSRAMTLRRRRLEAPDWLSVVDDGPIVDRKATAYGARPIVASIKSDEKRAGLKVES